MTNNVLATVNGNPITAAEVDEYIARLGQRGAMYNTPQGRAAILNQLVATKLLLLDAQRNLLEAEPAFRDQLKKMKDNLLAGYATQKLLASVTVTDAEAEAYYAEHPERFSTGETVNASHILVDSEELAKEIAQKIASNEITFEDAAKTYSSCPSKENGGNLGDFGRGQMVPEFDGAVFAMEVGEITQTPVKTQFGYHLIRLNAKNAPETLDYADIKDQVKETLLGEKQEKAYQSKINQLKILYPVDMLG